MTLPGCKMNDKLFAELAASIEEAGHIVREETAPSRKFTVEREPLDVVGIREGYKLSQTRFAALLGISVKTLRNWEQGRRTPAGPARILLQAQESRPPKPQENADEWLNDTEEQMAAEDAAWEATYRHHQDEFLALRETAQAEIDAHKTRPMFDEHGNLES